MIHVIIPVYRGLGETKRCIDSVIRASNSQACFITIIDDCSPEPELSDYLSLLPQNGMVRLLRNEENLGFVATVNLGMALESNADVVLLNSDTEVAEDWLDRLYRCAYSAPDIGTVTPFSNNATICSYPKFCQDNLLPQGWGIAELDALFRQVNAGKNIEIPTAVGFCMYIKRVCLDAVGLFDLERFGKGYGEENDFCMRARKRGWRHVLCADTFVFHAGGVSFAETQNPRKQLAQTIINRDYPYYSYLVSWHVKRDPARSLRHAVDLMRIRTEGRPVLLFITHRMGGGTERHIRELCEFLERDAEVLVLRPHVWREVTLSWQKSGEMFRLFFRLDEDYPSLLRVLGLAGVSRVHIHHLMGHSNLVKNLPNDLGVAFDLTVHDYHLICPRTTLTSPDHRYCGEPDEYGCNSCLNSPQSGGVSLIRDWRDSHAPLLNDAKRVFAPSMDVAMRIGHYVSGENIVVASHFDIPDVDSLPVPLMPLLKTALRVLVVGGLSAVKGPDMLERCALSAKENGLPLKFHLIGYAYRDLRTEPESNLTVHGRYGEAELQELIANSSPDLVWFPAQCPETYSYTLSAALLAGLPVVVPDIGAFAERVANRPLTWVCPWQWDSEQWNNFFMELLKSNFKLNSPIANSHVASRSLKYFEYRNYLVGAPLVATPKEANVDEIHALLAIHSRRRLHLFGRILLGLRVVIYRPVNWLSRKFSVIRAFAKIIPLKYRRRISAWLDGRWP